MAAFTEFVTGNRGEVVSCVNGDNIRAIHPNVGILYRVRSCIKELALNGKRRLRL